MMFIPSIFNPKITINFETGQIRGAWVETKPNQKIYILVTDKNTMTLQDFIWSSFYKRIIPDNMEIRKKNGDNEDHSIQNLELVNVYHRKGRWCSVQVKSINLETKEEKIFKSMAKAASFHKCNVGVISLCTRGLIKRAKNGAGIWIVYSKI